MSRFEPTRPEPPIRPAPVSPLSTPILTPPRPDAERQAAFRPIVPILAPHPDDDPKLRGTERRPSAAPEGAGTTPVVDAPRPIVPESVDPVTRPTAPPDPGPIFVDVAAHVELSVTSLLVREGGEPLLPVPRFRDLVVIGQFGKTYVLCEGDELVLVDQHAAHERITLHRLLRDRASRLGTSQRLLTPMRVELPASKVALLADQLDLLSDLHLEVERFGPSTLLVLGVPPILDGVNLPGLLSDLADELAAEKRSRSGEELVDHILATLACHTSVRANQALSHYEMRALLASLDEVDVAVCAHGRPVAIRIPKGELEHRFHRS